jgi:hypothetical protein
LDIEVEDCDIIPANQNLYCCDPDSGAVLELSATLLTNYVGSLLLTQAGEYEVEHPGAVFIVNWTGTRFVARRISYLRADNSIGRLEHATFAPIQLPILP